MANDVRVDLGSVETWRTLLGQINDDCVQDISAITKLITNPGTFKGHTADKAKEYAEEITQKAAKAHENLADVQKSLVAVQEKAENI